MMNLLVFKETIIKLYQKTEFYLKPIIKFLISFLVFQMINQQIGSDPKLQKWPVILALSLIGAFTPSSILVLMSAIIVVGHVYYVSKILSIIVIAAMLILYLLFARFAPKQGYAMLAVPILMLIKIPYIVPILLGMIASPIALIPTGCGVAIYYLIRLIKEMATNTSNSIEDILPLYKYVIDGFFSNKEMQLTIFVFAIVIIVTYLIRRLKIDYAFYIAILAGALTNIIAFLIGDLKLESTSQIGIMILNTIISALIVMVIQFFRLTLDYTAVERTQFEDDEYYYYVKAVPKMKITAPKKNVKHISVQKANENTMNLKQTIDKVSMEHEIQDSDVEGRELKKETRRKSTPVERETRDRIPQQRTSFDWLERENENKRDAYMRDILDELDELDEDYTDLDPYDISKK